MNWKKQTVGQWNTEKPLSQLYQKHTLICIYIHTHIQVLFIGLAPLQRRDKGLEGEDDRKNNQKKEEWIEY